MFSKHALQMRVVKRNGEQEDTTVGDVVYVLHEAGKGLVKGGMALLTVYMVLDTARTVTVNEARERSIARSYIRQEAAHLAVAEASKK